MTEATAVSANGRVSSGSYFLLFVRRGGGRGEGKTALGERIRAETEEIGLAQKTGR